MIHRRSQLTDNTEAMLSTWRKAVFCDGVIRDFIRLMLSYLTTKGDARVTNAPLSVRISDFGKKTKMWTGTGLNGIVLSVQSPVPPVPVTHHTMRELLFLPRLKRVRAYRVAMQKSYIMIGDSIELFENASNWHASYHVVYHWKHQKYEAVIPGNRFRKMNSPSLDNPVLITMSESTFSG